MNKPEPIGNYQSKWGEGPTWHNGRLLYVDIHAQSILEFDPETGKQQSWELDQQVGFVVPCKSGRLLWGGDNGFYFLDRETGTSTPIYDPEPDLPNNRFNDGKCSPDGRLYGGTIATDKVTGAAKLYCLDSDLSHSVAYGPVTNSNGLAWSADGKTLFYIDTPSKEVKAFDYDSATGTLSNPRVVVETSNKDSSPDGMTIDSEDNLWIAFCHGGHVARYNPETGKEVSRIDVPAHETTSCAFGGPKGNDLYISTGTAKDRDEEFGGNLFVVRDLPVSGPPAALFADA
ncbi:SMP-30/gluconolactonase/LRE family protein [Puniceicoccus vermicola]|uniref:SMP-30/gluconolactonase/LRE family protein n=1 Tax=Puniceicoccus vermicola TaxID=388746 RepID=A0A7X1B0A3_9BACT|nr:SMP-30/gluconolactonase/LRE family protein [Puniceicoccus vermicola]MBC2602130.1 SMP-30/gluconolactonase/LRE family protein [Puniceicoccus vermicola]